MDFITWLPKTRQNNLAILNVVENLPKIVCLIDYEVAHNSSIHRTTLFSPLHLNYGISQRTISVQKLFATSVRMIVHQINTEKHQIRVWKNSEPKRETVRICKFRRGRQGLVMDKTHISRRQLWIPKPSPQNLRIFCYQEKHKIELRRVNDIVHVSLLILYTEDVFRANRNQNQP